MTTNVWYSWMLQEWWNDYWSYNRIQYFSSEIFTNYLSVYCILQKGIDKLSKISTQTRLDIRISINENNLIFLEYLKKDFWNIDISIKKFNNTSIVQVILWKNKWLREVSFWNIQKIKRSVSTKINNTLNYINKVWWFENFAISQLDMIKQDWMYFEKDNFDISEILLLWSESFWWNEVSIKKLIKNNCWNSRLYWLRNKVWELISLVLITDWETTEWVTKKDYQWRWYINPLLIYANSNCITDIWNNLELYVHARCDRSLSPSIKSWMEFQIDDNRQYLLTSHVEIDGEYQTFVEWILNTLLYTSKLVDNYLSFN